MLSVRSNVPLLPSDVATHEDQALGRRCSNRIPTSEALEGPSPQVLQAQLLHTAADRPLLRTFPVVRRSTRQHTPHAVGPFQRDLSIFRPPLDLAPTGLLLVPVAPEEALNPVRRLK